MPVSEFTVSHWSKVCSLEPLVTLVCHVVTSRIHQYIQTAPLALSTDEQNRTEQPLACSVLGGKKKQSQRMSATGQVVPWLPPSAYEKLTNVRASIMSCWPFQN